MTRKPQIFIHVGAGKTGTSALQAFLYMNRDILERKGIMLFPDGTQVSGGKIAHHKFSAHRVSSREDALALWKNLAKMPHKKFILSSEFLHSKISGREGVEFFQEVRDILCNFEVKIIFYIRRHSQWLQSAYAQWVKGEREFRDFEVFAKEYPKNAPDQILDFSNVFGPDNMVVRPYERSSFSEADIFHDFMRAVDVEWDSAFQIPQGNENPRLAPDSLELKRISNSLWPDRYPRHYIEDILDFSHKTSESSSAIFHNHNIMSPGVQKSIEDLMSEKYRRVAVDVMGRQDGVLFKDRMESDILEKDSESKNLDITRVLIYQNIQLYRRISRLEDAIRALSEGRSDGKR